MTTPDSASSPPLERFHRTLQRFHWAIAVMVVSQLAVALVMTQLRSLRFGQWTISLHRQIGLLVMLLLLTRLALSWKFPTPKQPIVGLPTWQRHVAGIVHVAFKVLLIAQPVIGVFSAWARGDDIGLFGLFSVAAPWDISEDWHQRLARAHAFTGYALLGLIVTHVGAVIFNRYARNVPVLERMLPGRSAEMLVNRTRVGAQLTLGFSLLIAIMLLTGVYAVSQYRDATRRNAAMQSGELAAAEETREAQVAWKELVGRTNAQPLTTADDRLKELVGTATSKLQSALEHSSSGELKTALQDSLTKIGAATPAAGAWRGTDLVAVDSGVQDIVDSESANIFQLRSENDERTSMGHDLIVVTMVPTLVLGILVATLLSRSITGSLSRMDMLVRAVADGKPDGALRVVGHGEFSSLMRNMLAMRAAVESRAEAMLGQIRQIESERTRLAEEARSREAAAEARERSQREQQEAREREQTALQRQQLTREFESQVAGIVESVAATVESLKGTADRMASSAGDTSKSNREASGMARRTSDSAVAIAPSAAQLTATAGGFREHAESSRTQALGVIEEAAEARTQIDRLLGAAGQIGTIANEISDIARQTSLLSINARIQAALAGDEGKGFAVVATEVKELAAKTRHAVDAIGGHIDFVTSLANQSAEFLQRVLGRIETLESSATSICSSADAQCASTAEIAQLINEVSASIQSVAQNIDAAQATSSDTENMAAGVVQAAEKLSQQAVLLQNQVANFVLQIGDVGRRTPPATDSRSRQPAALAG